MAATPVFRQVSRQPDDLEEVGEMETGVFFRHVERGRTVPGWTHKTHRSRDQLVTVRSRQYGREEKEYVTDTSKLEAIAQQSDILDAVEVSKKNNPSPETLAQGLAALYGGRGSIPHRVLVTAYNERYKGNEASRHTFKDI
jgi:hypothetical protein